MLTGKHPFHNLNNYLPEKEGIKMKHYLFQHGKAKSGIEDPEPFLTALSPSVAMKIRGWYCSATEPLSTWNRKWIRGGQFAGFSHRGWQGF